MDIIETHNLSRCYRDQVAVDNLNLHVEPGCIFGLIGANGAGKTTTVRMLTTLLKPSAGTARVNGFDILKQPHQVRKSIGYVPQDAQADEALSGREHLILQGRLYGMDPRVMVRRIDEVLKLVGLKEDSDKRTLEYSGGMRKLLNIATGLLHTPKVLFLDEPTSGIDVVHRQRLLDHIRHLPAIDMTVFLTTHFLEEVDRLADRVALLDNGKVIIEGTPAELKASTGSSILDITFDPVEAFLVQKAAESLRHAAALTKILINGNRLKIFSSSGDDTLAEVRRQLSQLNLPFTSLTIAQPTLDDVFFYHIGRGVD